jgi:hypothetical protein
VYGDCHANKCEFLGNIHADYECAIPKHWRDGSAPYGHWNQQGNGLARTTLVVDARMDYYARQPR